jgi:hypothetical protein
MIVVGRRLEHNAAGREASHRRGSLRHDDPEIRRLGLCRQNQIRLEERRVIGSNQRSPLIHR